MEKNFYNLDFSKRLVSLKNSNISEVNKQLISDFVENCYAQGLGQQRVIKYISILKMIATQINIDFDKVEKRDLFTFISQLEQSDKGEWLKHDYKVGIKKFYRWYFNDDDPELTKWIKASISRRDRKLPEDMLIEEDILKMINCAKKGFVENLSELASGSANKLWIYFPCLIGFKSFFIWISTQAKKYSIAIELMFR